MGKILSLVLGLAVVGFIAYRATMARIVADPANGTPPQQLQNVREASKRIEANQDKAAEDALKKATPAD